MNSRFWLFYSQGKFQTPLKYLIKNTDPVFKRSVGSRSFSTIPKQPTFLNLPCSRSFIVLNKAIVLSKRAHLYSTQASLPRLKECWKCQKPLDVASFFCKNNDCAVIQLTPSAVNYFEILLRISPKFDIDISELRQSFLELQQKVHPDSHTQKEQTEFLIAQSQSVKINKAYNTLRDPLSRGLYLLKLQGIEVTEKDTVEDPEFLMQVMEAHEQLGESKDEESVEGLQDENDDRVRETIGQLSKAFNSNQLDIAKEFIIRLRYWDNFSKALNEWSPGNKNPIIFH